MTLYGEKDRALRPALQIPMPRSPRIYAPVDSGDILLT
jgi:hypothetical protein